MKSVPDFRSFLKYKPGTLYGQAILLYFQNAGRSIDELIALIEQHTMTAPGHSWSGLKISILPRSCSFMLRQAGGPSELQIISGQLNHHRISRHDPDIVYPHLSG